MFKRVVVLLIISLLVSCEDQVLLSDIKKKYYKNDSIVHLCTRLNRKGVLLRNQSDYRGALETHFQALEEAQKNQDTLNIAVSFNNIGTDLRRTSSLKRALTYHLKALEISGDKKELQIAKAISMNGLGNIMLALKEYDDAESYFEDALSVAKEQNNYLGQAINYANIGEVKVAKKEYQEGLYYFHKSLNRNEKINSKLGVSICKRLIGEVFLLKKQPEKGMPLLRESIELMKDSPDSFHLLASKLKLSEELINRNQYAEVNLLLNDILKSSQNINSYEFLFKAYSLLADYHKKQSNFKESLLAIEKSIYYEKLLNEQNNEVDIIEIKNKFRNKEITQEVEFLKRQHQLTKKLYSVQKRFFLFVFIVLSTLFILLYFAFRKRKQINRKLREVNSLKSKFFGNVSHEFRTPITLIQGPVEKVLASKEISKEVKDDMKMVQRNSQKLLFLVDRILSLSKIEAGKFEVKAEKKDLSDFIKKIARSFKFKTIDKELDYHIELGGSKNVWFDPNIVEMIVSNLLSNAFKYTPKGGSIVLKGSLREDFYCLKISNNVAKKQLYNVSRFFERFYSEKNNKEGTGIGLALTKELCNLYRSFIQVDTSDVDDSIEFSIKLPTQKEHFRDDEIASVGLESESEKVVVSEEDLDVEGELVMLIVEDNADMREYIKSIFKMDYTIIEAEDGKEGVEKAKASIPDIIISDVMMPNVNGLSLCDQLKNNELTSHIPIILLTALTSEEVIIRGFQNHADDYITKPFKINLLKLKVANLIEIRQKLQEKYKKEIVFKPLEESVGGKDRDFAVIVKNVLENHITESTFDVKKFCDIVGMSRTQLHRKINATTGMSTTEFIRVHRLKIASELLKKSDRSISEICYDSGFNSVSYFTKQFKSLFKTTPTAYREEK